MTRAARRMSAFDLSLVLAMAGCGSAAPLQPSAAPHTGTETTTTSAGVDAPPPPLDSKPSPFPKVLRTTLRNGLRVSVVESRALPIVELRVVIHAGEGFGFPGVSEITAKMLREGGTRAHSASEVVKRIETLGSRVDVAVGPDATRLSMGVVDGQLGAALDILGELLTTPRFDGAELERVKARMTDQAREDARANGMWSAGRLVFHELFPPSSPYASHGVVPSEIARVSGAAVRDFYRRLYVPPNVDVIVAGAVSADDAVKAADRAFGAWRPTTDALPSSNFPAPGAPRMTRVIVVDRPKSVQSDIVVADLVPGRHSSTWPTDRVAIQVFGGGMTGRLFQDVREKRSLAYAASAHPLELANGPQPLLAYVGTRAPETADAVQAVMDNLAGMRASPPTDGEVATARRYLSDIFSVRMETLGAISDMVAQLSELGLPDDYWDSYRAALRGVTTEGADREAAKMFDPDHSLILVVGDQDVVAAPLARFGEVTVVDPEHEFRTLRTLPKTGARSR